MAVEYYLVTQAGTSGFYWMGLSAEEKARYYYDGAYQCYADFNTLEDTRINNASNRSPEKSIVVEVQGKWDDTSSTNVNTVYLGYYSIEITSKINGVRDPDAFHYGVPGGGFRRIMNNASYAAFQIQKQSNMTIDGLEIINQSTTGGYGIRVYYAAKPRVVNNIITAYRGIECRGYAGVYARNIARNCTLCGILVLNNFGYADLVYDNLATGCGEGFTTDAVGTYATILNNVSVGNTVNWGGAGINSNALALNNAGEPGDSPWDSRSTAITTLSSSDFNNLSGGDYTYTSTSGLINAGTDFVGIEGVDINDNVKPNYESATYPNNARDLGPFEYDHGEGLAPSTVPISITGMAEGSAFAMYDTSDDSEIVAPTAIGSSGAYTDESFVYTENVSVKIIVRKGTSGTKYLPYVAYGTITASGLSVVVSQVVDTIA